MIKLELNNNPGYPTTNPEYYGTIHHSRFGVSASVNCDYRSTLKVRRYLCGLEPPNFPVPATTRTFRHSWGNDTAHVTIWPGVIQQRISDEPYTGFGQVITFDLVTGECETRYDDFD
jgi:hypothetical protein